MSFASPARSLSSLTGSVSGGMDDVSVSSTPRLMRSHSKQKRLQSAFLDTKRGVWVCRNCSWTYPNPAPDHHQRREHRKQCQGKVEQWLGAVRLRQDYGRSPEEGVHGASRIGATSEKPVAAARPIVDDDTDDGAKRGPDGCGVPDRDASGLEASDHNEASQILDTELESRVRPSSEDPQKETKIYKVADVKPEGDREEILSEHHGIAVEGENLKVEQKELESEKVPEEFEPQLNDLDRIPSSQEVEESDVKLLDGACQDRTDPMGPLGVRSSEFVAASEVSNLQSVDNVNKLDKEKQAGSGSLDTKEQLLQADRGELDNQKTGDHDAVAYKENPEIVEDVKKRDPTLPGDVKEKAENVDEGFEQREQRLTAADEGLPKEMAEGEPSLQPIANKTESPEDVLEVEGSNPAETEDNQKGGIGDEASENATSPGHPERGSAGGDDPYGQETKSIDTAVVEAKDVEVGQSSRRPPLLQVAGDKGQPTSGDQQTSHGQSDDLKNSEQEVDAPEHDRWELVDISDPEEGTNVDQLQGTHETRKVVVKLSLAKSNWDGWEDVIRIGSMLIQRTGALSTEKAKEAESSSGDYHASQGLLAHPECETGDVTRSVPGKTSAVSEMEGVIEGVIEQRTEAEAPSSTLHVLEGDRAVGLLTSRGDEDLKAAKEAIAGIASAPEVEDPEIKSAEVQGLMEGSDQNVSESATITTRPDTAQTSRTLPKLSSALRNWDDWEDVVRESGRLRREEKTDPILDPDLGEHQSGHGSPRCVDVDIVESDSPVGGEWIAVLSSHSGVRTVKDTGVGEEGVEGLNYEKPPEGLVTSVPEEAGIVPTLTVLKATVSNKGLSEKSGLLDSGLDRKEGRNKVGKAKVTPQHEPGQSGLANFSLADTALANWEDASSVEKVPSGRGMPSPYFDKTHDHGGSSSESPIDRTTLVNHSEESDDDESLSLRRRPRAGRIPPSFEPADVEGPESFTGLKGASRRRPIKSAAGSLSPRDMVGTVRSRRSMALESVDNKNSSPSPPPHVPLSRSAGYRANRQDGRNEITSKVYDHLHLHGGQWETAPVLKFDVVSVLRDQTRYDLICSICGSLITKKIVLRKKKRRYVRETDASLKPSTVPAVLDDEEDQGARSDTSSEIEDEKWNGGCVACLNYYFRA